jgi:hypothetical protein
VANHVIRDRIWESKKLRRCSKEAALAYPWIYLVADSWGRFEFNPPRIWALVFGGRKDVSPEDVERWLSEYEREELLIRYHIDGELAVWSGFYSRAKKLRKNSQYPDPAPFIERRKKLVAKTRRGCDQISGRQLAPTKSREGDREGELDRDREYGSSVAGATADVVAVFDHWKTATGKGKAKLDEKRAKAVAAMLRAGYSADDLKRAVDGCQASPFHQGENKDRRIYNSLTLICRDAEHVDMFMGIVGARPEGLGLPTRAAFDDAESA